MLRFRGDTTDAQAIGKSDTTSPGVGEPAPDFGAALLDGSRVQLRQLRGTPVWLAFFRWAQCPLCNFRIHELVSVWADRFANQHMAMLAVFQSPAQKLAGLTERHRPPFRVIPDPEMQLYELYGLGTSARGLMGADVRRSLAGARAAGLPLVSMWDGPPLRTPADFLIDESGVIRVAYQGKNIADHIPFDAVTHFLESGHGSARGAHSSTS